MVKIYLILFAVLLFSGCKPKEPPKVETDHTLQFIAASMQGDSFKLKYFDVYNNYDSIIWANKKEQVVSYTYSPTFNSAYIITAKSIITKGAFPELRNLSIYLVKFNDKSVTRVSTKKQSIQAFTDWDEEGHIKIVLNNIDLKRTNIINQEIEYYNEEGSLLYKENKVYDLAKEGFPYPPNERIKINSNNNIYTLFFGDKQKTKLAIKKNGSTNKSVITFLSGSFDKAFWSNDNNYLAFTTTSTQEGLKNLYLYNIATKLILQEIKGKIRNFVLHQDHLIFEEIVNNISIIKYYNIHTKKWGTIKSKTSLFLRYPSSPTSNK